MPDKNIRLSVPEHPFAPYVRILGKGKRGSRSFSESEAQEAMQMILANQVEDLQLGAFLMLLRVKEETPEELSGFVKAVQQDSQAPGHIKVDLDWSSYAGKRRHLPWFIFSIVLLANAGYRIFIHGASGHTSNRLYTETLFRELGLPVSTNWAEVETQLDEFRFTYMPLRHISQRLEEMINMRPILGLRSPVHSLSRLINPLQAPCVLQGIFHPPYSRLHQEAGMLLDYNRVTVIKGEGGEIERNPDNALTCYQVDESRELKEERWEAMFPRRHVKPEDLTIDHMRDVWRGAEEDEYARGAIVGTTALALKILKPEKSQASCIAESEALWQSRDPSRF